jgi:hypothetical protein
VPKKVFCYNESSFHSGALPGDLQSPESVVKLQEFSCGNCRQVYCTVIEIWKINLVDVDKIFGLCNIVHFPIICRYFWNLYVYVFMQALLMHACIHNTQRTHSHLHGTRYKVIDNK